MAGSEPLPSPDLAQGSSEGPERKVKPPRPANPWILYRAAKFAAMRAGLESPITQGSVSRQVAAMWKKEPEHVKRFWERAAEDEKAKHQVLYPNYRYCPMKREDKQREKKERKQNGRKKTAKVRDATSAPCSNSSPTVTTPSPPPALQPSADTAIGARPSISPSPPTLQLPANTEMASDSAVPVLPPSLFSNQSYLVPGYNSGLPNHYYWPESRYGPCGPSPPISAAPSPVPSPNPQSSVVPPSSSPSAHPSPGSESQDSSSSQLTLYHPSSSNASPNGFTTQPLPPLLFHTSPSVADNMVTPVWNNGQLPNFDPLSLETVDLDVPINHGQTFAGFQQDSDNSTFDSLQALLVKADGHSLWDFPGTGTNNLVSQPQGVFNIDMASEAQMLDYNDHLFTDFDYAEFERQMASLAAGNSSHVPPAPLAQEDIQSLFRIPNNPEIQAYAAARQRQPSAFTLEMMKLMDLEAAEAANTQATFSNATLVPVPTTVAPHQVGLHNAEHVAEMPIFTQVTNTPTVPSGSSYVPPAGAIYSSTRRVAASWKPPLATPLQMEETTQTWASHYAN